MREMTEAEIWTMIVNDDPILCQEPIVTITGMISMVAQRVQLLTQQAQSERTPDEEFIYAQGVVSGIQEAEQDIVRRFYLIPKPLQRGPDPDDLPDGW